MKNEILITGSNGICGSVLVESGFIEKYDLILLDIINNRNKELDCICYNINLGDIVELENVFSKHNIQIIIHLGGSSQVDSNWSEVLHNNIIGTYNLFSLAIKYNIKRIIFASTNHVVGMHELNNKNNIYNLLSENPTKQIIHKFTEVAPDSLYGVSKLFGENLCKYYSDNFDIQCFIIRIGSVREKEADHPYNYAEKGVKEYKWKRGSKRYIEQELRLKSLWMSRKDFVILIEGLLNYETQDKFDIFYAISKNDRRFYDIEYTEKKLNISICDNSELIELKDIDGINNN